MRGYTRRLLQFEVPKADKNLMRIGVRLLMLTGLLFYVLASPTYSAVLTFSSTESLTIPAVGPAHPFPWTIDVAGVTGPVLDVRVTLRDLHHSFPNDLGALLVGPTGQAVLLFDGPGDEPGDGPLTWVFADSAGVELPTVGPLSSGVFKPGQNEYSSSFGGFAPPFSYNLSDFSGLPPNGRWNLYVEDFSDTDSGTLGSWSLQLSVSSEPAAIPEVGTAQTAMLGALLIAACGWRAVRARPTTI